MSRIACESFSCTRCMFFVGLASRNAAVLWLQQVLKCPFELLLSAQNFALSTYTVKIVWRVWPTPMSAFSGSLSENFCDHSSVLICMRCLQQRLVDSFSRQNNFSRFWSNVSTPPLLAL